jgi:hypothetical protein
MGVNMSRELTKLLEAAKNSKMTSAEKEEQRRSFAYGNANIENEFVTRETIDRAAEQIGAESDDSGRK